MTPRAPPAAGSPPWRTGQSGVGTPGPPSSSWATLPQGVAGRMCDPSWTSARTRRQQTILAVPQSSMSSRIRPGSHPGHHARHLSGRVDAALAARPDVHPTIIRQPVGIRGPRFHHLHHPGSDTRNSGHRDACVLVQVCTIALQGVLSG